MEIPRFWSKGNATALVDGKKITISCWAHSNESESDALRKALRAAGERAKRIDSGDRSKDSYPDRPIREEIVRDLTDPSTSVRAIVTRNHYGALILNVDRMMMIDIDDPEVAISFMRRVTRFFRAKDLDSEIRNTWRKDCLAALDSVFSSRPGWAGLVYRTHSGFRVIVTHAPIGIEDPSFDEMMKLCWADKKYWRLCRSQLCYRARLTPKPWRIGIERPEDRFAWSPEERERRARWVRIYENAASTRSSCWFVMRLGSGEIDPAFAPLIRFHDEISGVERGAPLA